MFYYLFYSLKCLFLLGPYNLLGQTYPCKHAHTNTHTQGQRRDLVPVCVCVLLYIYVCSSKLPLSSPEYNILYLSRKLQVRRLSNPALKYKIDLLRQIWFPWGFCSIILGSWLRFYGWRSDGQEVSRGMMYISWYILLKV